MVHERVAHTQRERDRTEKESEQGREGDCLSVQAAGVLFKQAVIRASCWHTDRTCNCFYSSPCRRHTAKCRKKPARESVEGRGVCMCDRCALYA